MKKRSIPTEMLAPQFVFIPADLAVQSAREALIAHPYFISSKRTIVVIEGVLMYLSPETVEKLFQELMNLFSVGLACIFTFMNKQPNGNIQFQTAHPIVNWWLIQKHERFLWGYPGEMLPQFLKKLGFDDVKVFGDLDLIKNLFMETCPLPKLALGELICQAIRLEPD